MNLRETMKEINENKEQEQAELNTKELKKRFVTWINSGEVDETTKETIYDELQKCLDSNSIEVSIFKEELLEAKMVFALGLKSVNNRNARKNKKSLYDVESNNFPTELQIMIKKLQGDKNVEKLNEALAREKIPKLSENYTVENIELIIVNYIDQNKYTNSKDNFITENGHLLGELIANKNAHHFTIENNGFKHLFSGCVAIYIYYYLKNVSPIMNAIKIRALYNSFGSIVGGPFMGILKKMCTLYGFDIIYCDPTMSEQKKSLHLETCIVCLKEDKEKALKKYKDVIDESCQWRKMAETIFKPVVSRIDSIIKGCKIESLPSATGIDFDTKSRAEEIHVRSQIKQHLEQNKSFIDTLLTEKGISNFWFIPTDMGNIVYLFKNNLYAQIPIYKKYGEPIPYIGNTQYSAFSAEDIIEISNEEDSFKLDISIPPTKQKPASVIGRALVGNAIGGTVGGILGAASAIEKNARDANYRANYKPIKIDVKYKIINVFTYWDIHMEKDFLGIDLGKSKDPIKYIEKFLTAYQTAKSSYELAEGNFLKMYVSEHSGDFKESDYREFIEQIEQEIHEEEEKAKEERRAVYWSKHPSKKEALESEKETLDGELMELEQQLTLYDLRKQELKNEYSREVTAENELNQIKGTIKSLEEKRSSLGLFKGKEKKLISAQIIDLTNKIDILDGEILIQKEKQTAELKKQLSLLEKEFSPIQTRYKSVQKRKTKIIDELQKDR